MEKRLTAEEEELIAISRLSKKSERKRKMAERKSMVKLDSPEGLSKSALEVMFA